MIRPAHILPFVFLALLSGAVVVVRAHRATPVAAQEARSGAIAPVGVLVGGPSLTGAQVDAVLASYGSPAEGSGPDFYTLSIAYGIDDAYALAFFVHESSAATNPAWAGWKADGTTTHNLGNIVCAGYPTCYGRFRDYPTWHDGIEGWYRLIRDEYIVGRGHTTVADVIPIYAPASDSNDEAGYINAVEGLVAGWRASAAQNGTQRAPRASATGGAYMLQGDIGTNVLAALNANGGALQAFEIPPGATWSFGRSIKPIAAMGYLPVVCGPAGCNAGGGWCDLAALYVKVSDQLGLESRFPSHGGISDSRFPGILLDDNNDDGDLWITNTTNAAVTFRARIDDGVVTIEGS